MWCCTQWGAGKHNKADGASDKWRRTVKDVCCSVNRRQLSNKSPSWHAGIRRADAKREIIFFMRRSNALISLLNTMNSCEISYYTLTPALITLQWQSAGIDLSRVTTTARVARRRRSATENTTSFWLRSSQKLGVGARNVITTKQTVLSNRDGHTDGLRSLRSGPPCTHLRNKVSR